MSDHGASPLVYDYNAIRMIDRRGWLISCASGLDRGELRRKKAGNININIKDVMIIAFEKGVNGSSFSINA